MKEHVQEPGIRKWAGDDLVELQNEPLSALQALVEPYAPCILQGCEVSVVEESTYKLSEGMAALRGEDAQGNPCVKIVRVPEVAATTLPVHLYLGYETLTRLYASNEGKPVAYDYFAKVSTSVPAVESFLTITAAGGLRLPDKMGITQKLDRDGGEAKDVTVTFAQASSRTLPASGSKLGTLMGSIRKWLYDLKALAFKDKVASSDLDDGLSKTLSDKADKKDLNEKLSLSGGEMNGPITFPTASTNTKDKNYISSGGGYGTGSGKHGLKLLSIDAPDAQAGIGQDLTGRTYETCLAAAQNPNNANQAYITFAKHLRDTDVFTKLGEIDGAGNLNMNGQVKSGGKVCLADGPDRPAMIFVGGSNNSYLVGKGYGITVTDNQMEPVVGKDFILMLPDNSTEFPMILGVITSKEGNVCYTRNYIGGTIGS